MDKNSRGSKPQPSITFQQLVERVTEAWLDDFDLSEQSVRRFIEISGRFQQFLERRLGPGIAAGEVAALDCEVFVKALIPGGDGAQKPANTTMLLRRTTLRLLFRTARDLGLYEGDPTLDLILPPQTMLKVRALTDGEVALSRSFSLRSLTETRLPAAWALAEATARTSEIPHIRGSDIDLKGSRVWLHGSPKAETRWGLLTSWGLTQITRGLEKFSDLDRPLTYSGTGKTPEARRSASCMAIMEVLRRAGLASEPDVRPGSVVAWAGARIYEETGRIEEVARRLGMRSLDRAARFIDWDWKS